MTNSALPQIQTYEARDGRSLCYRHYVADSNKVMILLHGVSVDGQYLHPLAEFISKQQLAQVYVPDLRGYGPHPIRRGDVEYIGQYDDDLEDLMKWIQQRSNSPVAFVLAGHSLGGATAIRLARKPVAEKISAFLLLSSAIHPKAPINRKNDPQSSLHIDIPKIIVLTALNAVGLRFLNHWTVMRIDKPMDQRKSTDTLKLSYRLALSRVPKSRYERYLQAMTQPTLVLVAQNDEVFLSDQYEALFAQHNKAKVSMIPDSNHDGMLSSEHTFNKVQQWLRAL